nr:hypothetical protein [Allonocardiopsis opalescens]
MEISQVESLRAVLATTGWIQRTEEFADALRTTREPGGLLLFGTPVEEPWHLAAHLDDESRYAGLPQLRPTLVRWRPPPDAPPHLSVGLDRLGEVRRGETLFVVSPEPVAPVPLLERVDDARRSGATVLALDQGDTELHSLAHEALGVVPEAAPVSFDAAQHLVSYAAGGERPKGRRGLRDYLSAFLDVVSGPHVAR